ncbi:GAF domain-containing protein [Streptomyces sp. NPDC091292]|uniref:sensor histidine kinase n=1 Tax=Streptomyces sp. NPDC091292 TaxID=3365991 RepID=UPI003823ED86
MEHLPLLLEAVLGVGTDLDPRVTLQRLVDSAAELTGARYAALSVTGPADGTHDTHGTRHAPYTTGTPAGPSGTRLDVSVLDVPVHVEHEVCGALRLERHGAPFTADDEYLVRVLAAQAGIAIGNARLYAEARRRERWIEGAAAVTTALLTEVAAADALVTVAEQARDLADASAGVILQRTHEGGMEIVAASTRGEPVESGRPGDPGDLGDLVGTTIAPGSAVLTQLLGGEPVFIDDSATDPRMTTRVRSRFGPSMMLPLQSGGRLIGTLALPRGPGGPPYTRAERLLAVQFASQAAAALVLADAQQRRERLAVFDDRDRIARDLHDLVVQRLFATGMMLESTRRRAVGAGEVGWEVPAALGRAVDELEATIQEVRTAIFALRQPPADAPTSVRGRVLRETAGAAAVLGFAPSVHFTGPVDARLVDPVAGHLLAALRRALATVSRRPGTTGVAVTVDVTARLPDGRAGVRLTVRDDNTATETATETWQSPL